MPYSGSDFPNAQVGETITYFFDFTNALASGETIAGVIWTVAVAYDSNVYDASAASIVDGTPAITGSIVGQKFAGMVAGVKYLVQANVTTSSGNVLETYSHFYTEIPE